MKSKKWVHRSICTLVLSTCILATYSFLYNANYYFNHNILYINKFNPDERKYKVNYLNNKKNNYNSILLGASSASYINEKDFNKFKVYNFSVSAMLPYEYQHAISHLEKNNNGDIKNIFIALEFFTSNKNEVARLKDFRLANYILESRERSFILKELLNSQILNSLKNHLGFVEYETYYTRWNNLNHAQILTETKVKENIKKGIEHHRIELEKYNYYSNYGDELLALKKSNSGKRFYVVITPVTKTYMDLILRTRFDSYAKWLKETIEVFENIYVYPYPNSISNNYLTNFRDNRHYVTSTGKEMVNSMFNKNNGEYILLNKDNFSTYINNLRIIKAKLKSLN